MSIIKPGGVKGRGRSTSPAGVAQSKDRKGREAGQLSALLKQVSDPTRLQIVRMLANGEAHVGALCEQLGQSQPAVSHHLALLRHGGIIAPRRQGKNNLYHLTETGAELARVVDLLSASTIEGVNHQNSAAGAAPAIDPELFEDVAGLVDDPHRWFHTPNVVFEGRKPVELLGTPDEGRLRDRIEAAKLGFFS